MTTPALAISRNTQVTTLPGSIPPKEAITRATKIKNTVITLFFSQLAIECKLYTTRTSPFSQAPQAYILYKLKDRINLKQVCEYRAETEISSYLGISMIYPIKIVLFQAQDS